METKVKEHLASMYGVDKDDVDALFALARQTVVTALGRLERARALADMKEAAEAGHMLKGALLNMGLAQLGDEARQLEMAAKQGLADEVGGRIELLSRELLCLVRCKV